MLKIAFPHDVSIAKELPPPTEEEIREIAEFVRSMREAADVKHKEWLKEWQAKAHIEVQKPEPADPPPAKASAPIWLTSLVVGEVLRPKEHFNLLQIRY